MRNVWASNMAVRRAAFDAAGGFREDFGKVGAVSRPEDTDLCLRVTGGRVAVRPGQRGQPLGSRRSGRGFRYFLCPVLQRGPAARRGSPSLNGAPDQHVGGARLHGPGAARAILRGLGEALRGDGVGRAARRGDHRAASAWPRPASPSAACGGRVPPGPARGRRAGGHDELPPGAGLRSRAERAGGGITAPGHAAPPSCSPAGTPSRSRSSDVPLRDGKASADQVARALWLAVAEQVTARLCGRGRAGPGGRRAPPGGHRTRAPRGKRQTDFPEELLTSGLRLPWPPSYLLGRATTLRNAPPASVIDLHQGPHGAAGRCLTAVLRQDYPDFEVIVVDNAPDQRRGGATWCPACARPGPTAFRCGTSSSRGPGLSWARNTGLPPHPGAIVAYLDDDEHPDRHWLAELARGFTLGQRVAGVSGLVLPAELDTPAQACTSSSAGTARAAASPPRSSTGVARPPAPAVPAAGVRRRRVHGLRPRRRCCGSAGSTWRSARARPPGPARTPRRSADLMLDGGTFVYWPGAVMWHEHRQEFAEVERQLDGYGSGPHRLLRPRRAARPAAPAHAGPAGPAGAVATCAARTRSGRPR